MQGFVTVMQAHAHLWEKHIDMGSIGPLPYLMLTP
jgi:hypothetical protein